MGKKWLLFLCIISLVFLPSCTSKVTKKSQKISQAKKQRKKIVHTQEYTAKIGGVECKLCAESVVNIIKKVDGIVDVFYCKTTESYEDVVFIILWDIKKGEIPKLCIHNLLQEEDFDLESLDIIKK